MSQQMPDPKSVEEPSEAGARPVDVAKAERAPLSLPFWKMGLIFAAGVIAALVLPEDFTQAQRIMMGIFVAAAGLWVTEAVPPFATAILVIVSSIYLLGQPGGALGFESERDYLIFINPVADPVIVLFFGGFILAIAATKYGLDRILASVLLRPFAGSPRRLLLGVILVTGFFSMFMSNTATALMMVAILLPLLRGMRADDPFRVGLALAVAFAANIGGMGTIIGTPPNAIAVSALAGAGVRVTFLSWMVVGMPVALFLLGVLWLVLRALFPSRGGGLVPVLEQAPKPDRKVWVVGLTFLATVVLWMSEALHGLSPAIVALVPLTVFTATGLLGASDLKRVEWDVLILVAGGLALGVGLQATELSGKIVSLLPLEGVPQLVVILVLAGATVVLSNFMSNTSAANILIPMAVALGSFSPEMGALTVAFCASLAMSLPISTPPNAVVYGTGVITGRDLLLAGSIVTVSGVGAVAVLMYFLGSFLTAWLGS